MSVEPFRKPLPLQRESQKGSPEPPERILIIRLKSIGDILHTLPAVNAVRKNHPKAHISYLVCKSHAQLIEGFDAVDEIVSVDRKALKSTRTAIHSFTSILWKIRFGGYTHVIDLQGYGETAWLSRLTRAPIRWGSVYREGRRSAYTRGITRRDDLHVIDWNLRLLKECGLDIGPPDNTFNLPNHYRERARAVFREHALDPQKPTLLIQPFTSREEKNWPFVKYLAVAEFFQTRGIQILFCGGQGDNPRLELARANGFPAITGEPLLVTAGLIELSRFVLGGDTGVLHLAVALNTRVLMLFNRDSSQPGCSIPYAHPDWVIDPTNYPDLSQIPTERVIDECQKTLTPDEKKQSPLHLTRTPSSPALPA